MGGRCRRYGCNGGGRGKPGGEGSGEWRKKAETESSMRSSAVGEEEDGGERGRGGGVEVMMVRILSSFLCSAHRP